MFRVGVVPFLVLREWENMYVVSSLECSISNRVEALMHREAWIRIKDYYERRCGAVWRAALFPTQYGILHAPAHRPAKK